MHAATLSSRFNVNVVIFPVKLFFVDAIFDIAIAQHGIQSIFHVVSLGQFFVCVDGGLCGVNPPLCWTLFVPIVQIASRMPRAGRQICWRIRIVRSRMVRTRWAAAAVVVVVAASKLFLGLQCTPSHGNACLAAATVVTAAKTAPAAASALLVVVNDKVMHWRK